LEVRGVIGEVGPRKGKQDVVDRRVILEEAEDAVDDRNPGEGEELFGQ
jgi:hypothetical protein